ncbi:CoA pyrophosphatase [Melaminivora sp.]|uniref:CoA pyrophosphatase n=1 Tax=Melaminivora sp. TaxID=1933032 RepID=UPI0028A63F80|nr:CoA pyrophosphatase [Melaminivora sp.]
MPPLPPSLPPFDPRTVPIIGVDAHLPPVAPAAQAPDALRRRFATPPAWTPEIRREPPFMDRPPAQAAVLVPIVMHERPTVLLTERTAHLSTHSGQVAFPGGRTDPEDTDATATALREAEEEVGLAPRQVEVLGELSTYVTGSSFIVTPVVGLVAPGARLTPNPHEVADVFEVPLDYLLDPAHHQRHLLRWQGHEREWFAMPYEDHGRTRFIWGATAGMLRNLYRFLAA